MGWFNKADKRYLVRNKAGQLVGNVDAQGMNEILNNIKSSDITVKGDKYVFLNGDGFKIGNRGIELYFWEGYTIDCIPTEVS